MLIGFELYPRWVPLKLQARRIDNQIFLAMDLRSHARVTLTLPSLYF